MGTMVTRRLREMTEEDISKITDTFKAFDDGLLEDEKGFCQLSLLKRSRSMTSLSTPGRYVGLEEQEDDGEPFEEKMERLTNELAEMFRRSHELEDEIRKRMGDWI